MRTEAAVPASGQAKQTGVHEVTGEVLLGNRHMRGGPPLSDLMQVRHHNVADDREGCVLT